MSLAPPVPSSRILRANDAAKWLDADAMLRQARDEAARMLASTAEAVEAARRQGFEEGHRAGAEEGARLLEQGRIDAARLVSDIENDLMDLALAVVARILDGFDDRDLVVAAIRPALRAFGEERDLTVTVSPTMAPQVEAFVQGIAVDGQRIELVADRHLDVRQCLVSDGTGSVDAGVDTQLAAIRALLVDSVAGALP